MLWYIMVLEFSLSPREAVSRMLKSFSTRRMRDVIEKRFGLRGGKPKTLEAIGREYRITRERVRQIESEALRHAGTAECLQTADPVLSLLYDYTARRGHVVAEQTLFSDCPDASERTALAFLLEASPQFQALKESPHYHRRWTTHPEYAKKVEAVLDAVVSAIAQKNQCVTEEELRRLVAEHAQRLPGESMESDAEGAWIQISKRIRSNPYGEYGLAEWPAITPGGVREKARLALTKAGTPLHFLDVARAINGAGWSTRRAHPQTVHNELIKDPRFVLVGRGLYALAEWGYEPGPVRDVMVSVLRDAGRPLSRDEIIKAVLDKRAVKTPTILLNLHNRSVFKRTDTGHYMLA